MDDNKHYFSSKVLSGSFVVILTTKLSGLIKQNSLQVKNGHFLLIWWKQVANVVGSKVAVELNVSPNATLKLASLLAKIKYTTLANLYNQIDTIHPNNF